MRRCFFPPDSALSLDLQRLRGLFDALGVREESQARVLFDSLLPLDAADILDELAILGTTAGRDALVEAARDLRIACDWLEEAPMDLAARLLAERARGALHDRVIERAHVRLGRTLPDRMAYELVGREARVVKSTSVLENGLRELSPDVSDVWLARDDDVIVAAVLHAMPVEVEVEHGERRARRVLRATIIRYEIATARLTVTPARPQMLDAIAAEVGRALFHDEAWFEARPAFTLKPLQILGARGLAKATLPASVKRARVIACTLDTGRGHRREARGPDALAEIEADLRSGGYLTKATLRFDIDGSKRPVDVVIELPGKIGMRARRFEREARAAMCAIGIMEPGALADDVVTLAPWVHAEWRWSDVLGAEAFARMTSDGSIVRVEGKHTRRVASAAWRALGRSYVTFPLDDERDRGASYAVAEDWAVPSTTVRDDQLVMWKLDIGGVAARMRDDLGLCDAKVGDLPDGVIFVGELKLASGAARIFYVVGALWNDDDRTRVGRAVAKASGLARPVLLVPRGRRVARDHVEIEIDVHEQLGAKSVAPRLAEIATELGVLDEIDPWRLVDADVRLVIDAKSERVWLDRVLLTHLGQSGFAMILALAKRGGDLVPSRDVEKAMSPKRPSEGAAKAAAKKIPGWVRASFEAAGKRAPDDEVVAWVANRGWKIGVRTVIR